MLLSSVIFILLVLMSLLVQRVINADVNESTLIRSMLFYWAVITIIIIISSTIKKHWKEYFLIFCSTLITFVMLEYAVRCFFPYKGMLPFKRVTSRAYHHLPSTNNTVMYANTYKDKQVTCRINEDFLRTDYSREKFLTYRDRIVVMGDSFVFGSGLMQEWTVAQVIEQQLRKRLRRNDIAVLNAGIESYSPFLEYILYSRKLHRYQPTLVLLVVDPTDIGDDYKYLNEALFDGEGYYFNLPDNEIKYYGALLTLANPLVKRFVKYARYPFNLFTEKAGPENSEYDWYDFSVTIDNTTEKNRFFIYRHPLEKTRPFFQTSLHFISMIANSVQQAGGRFVLVISPRYHHWSSRECPQNWEVTDYALDEPFQFEYFRFFEEARDDVNFDIYNLLPDFQKSKEFPLVFWFDPHWTKEGASLVGTTLTDYLLKKNYIN